jgi:tetratricopeptide (TPR) repeat protein
MEDLHWIDGETQALLDSLVESLSTARLLLLVNYRSEYTHGWSHKPYYQQVGLDPLPPEGVDAMLQALLGTDPSLQPLKRLLIDRTEGNPFFLEESIRTLLETKALLSERGSYRLSASLESLHIPITAQTILAARIDRLSPEDKRLLQTAAVIGNRVPLSLLQAVADQDEDAVHQGFARLQAAGFLDETGLFPDVEYTFRHALTHEVAYGSLLHERRRTVHARIVGAVEAFMPDRLAEQIDALALHAVRGEVWDKAVHYLREAGMKALWRSANREAAAYFEQALAHLARLPETSETLAQAVDIRLELRNALVPLGESQRILTCLQEAEALAKRLEDACRLGWISVYMSRQLWISGHSRESRPYAKTAYDIAESCGDQSLKVRSSLYLGFSCHTLGEYERAAGCYREIAKALSGELGRKRLGPTTLPAASALAFLARSLADRGEFEEGITQGQEAVRISEAAAHMYNLLLALWSLGYLYSIRGDFRSAVAPLERGLDLSREWSVTEFSSLYIPWSLGYVYALSGRMDEGLALLEQGVASAEPLGEEAFLAMALVQRGEACVHANRVADAQALGGRALALARERGERGHEAYALHLLGASAVQSEPLDPEAAEKQFRQAMMLAEELGMRPLAARCHLGLGQLYRRTGFRRQGEECVFHAKELLGDMGMAFWLETAERELRELRKC